MSLVAIKAGVALVLEGVEGVGLVEETRMGLPAWLANDHRQSAYCVVTRDPNAPGLEEAVGVGPIVFHYTNVRVEVWLNQTTNGSQADWDALQDRIEGALRVNKTLGGLSQVECAPTQPVVDDEVQMTDGAAEIWLHHAIYLLRVREVVRYQPV